MCVCVSRDYAFTFTALPPYSWHFNTLRGKVKHIRWADSKEAFIMWGKFLGVMVYHTIHHQARLPISA